MENAMETKRSSHIECRDCAGGGCEGCGGYGFFVRCACNGDDTEHRPCRGSGMLFAFGEWVVESWSDVDGFAVVDGRRVQGGKGVDRVPVLTSCQVTCQGRCHRENVTWPLSLYSRYEHALGRAMYWFGPAAGDLPRVCSTCAAVRS